MNIPTIYGSNWASGIREEDNNEIMMIMTDEDER
jgi:hypothetical protein